MDYKAKPIKKGDKVSNRYGEVSEVCKVEGSTVYLYGNINTPVHINNLFRIK